LKQLRGRKQLAFQKSATTKSDANTAALKEIERELGAVQRDLLEAVFARQCFRKDIEPDPVTTRGASEPPPTWVEINSYYATNRKQTGSRDPEKAFGNERTSNLTFGSAVVSIPTERKPGELNQPKLWRLELRPDRSKHFVLKSASQLALDKVKLEWENAFVGTGSKSVLLFVHGYNVSFRDAALRSAQLAHDLSFPGISLFFSWPSAGSFLRYSHDEEKADLSEDAFDALVDVLESLGPIDVYLVAHSMGNRIVTNVLARRAEKNKPTNNVHDLLLAAPDINEERFLEKIVPWIKRNGSTRRTIYTSDNDVALVASKVMHDFRRLGEGGDGVFVHPDFDTVDASGVAPRLRAFGHAYVVDSQRLIKDIQNIVTLNAGAEMRGLAKKGVAPKSYWTLQ
jgi:esterase/lipase superfamily enzyme